MPIDEIALNFNPTSLFILNIILGIIMFGVALDMKVSDFATLRELPRSAVVGLVSQFLLLPAFTFVLILLLRPQTPSIALGMILVAACPGGNISNFFAYLARGNTALSVSLTAVSTAFAMFMTPLNFTFWGSRIPGTEAILQQIALDPVDMVITIFLLLGLPLALGLFISHRFPAVANKMKRPMKIFSMVFFLAFVFIALFANLDNFINHIGLVAFTVFVHNATAISLGYFGGRAVGVPEADRRALAIEVGIQNSGLGLILIFNFFDGLGGMAIIAAWWGVWHIISGYTLAFFWSRRAPQQVGLANV